jgi:adenosylcobinamide-GDP ribazoletransferase
MSGLATAVSLLTRVPVRAEERGANVARSLVWFPLVGAAVGFSVGGVYASAQLIMPALLAAGLAVGVGIIVTGAFHEDGLADTADAFFGGWTVEERLRILKDPAHGTYGILAIALSVVLRVAAIAGLGVWTALAVVPAAHALSRGASVALLTAVRPASESGLGATYAGGAGRRSAVIAIAVALAITGGALGAWAIAAAVLAAVATWIVGWLAVSKIRGVTGDVLGLAEQVTEIGVLILGAAVVHSRLPLPWW